MFYIPFSFLYFSSLWTLKLAPMHGLVQKGTPHTHNVLSTPAPHTLFGLTGLVGSSDLMSRECPLLLLSSFLMPCWFQGQDNESHLGWGLFANTPLDQITFQILGMACNY